MSYLLKFKNRASSRPSRHRVKKDSKVNSPTVCTHYALESHLSANGGRRRRAELSNEVPQERRGSARGEQQAVPQGLDGFALAFARCDRSAQKKENKAPNKNGISPPCVEGGGKENLTARQFAGFSGATRRQTKGLLVQHIWREAEKDPRVFGKTSAQNLHEDIEQRTTRECTARF